MTATETGAPVGVITAEIVRSGLTSAALEMYNTLVRTAYNPLLYEVQDFGLAIVSDEGSLWGEAPGITAFLGMMPDTIKSGLARHGRNGFSDGDVLIVNDPYQTGNHIADTTVYLPIFHESELVAFAVSTAHWADIGGKSPGGWCPDSTDVYQEGICCGHERLVRAGVVNDDLWSLLLRNVRFPTVVEGDLQAQIAACRQGAARVQALCARYGASTVRAAMAHVIERTDEAVRRQVSEIPDGVYTASIEMDHDGVVKDQHPRIAVTLTVAGDRIRVSFEGTSEATRGPLNVPAIGTRSVVRVALKALLMPLDPTNDGHFQAFDFDLPPGLLVSPERPSPCDSYGYACVALEELTIQALARAIPERCPAGGYQIFGSYLFRVDPRDGEPFVFIDVVDGGNGALPADDGATLMLFPNGDVPNTPVEIVETRYPLRCERFGYLTDVAGAGRHRGGFGVVRDLRILEPGIFMQSVVENTYDPMSRGAAGGADGRASLLVVWPDTEKELRLQERLTFFGPFEPGDVISIRSGGGGGWGSPLERDPEQVRDDVEDELLTIEEASDVYGVVLLDEPLRVDAEATRAMRVHLGVLPAR